MGRWDSDDFESRSGGGAGYPQPYGGRGRRRNWVRIIRFAIIGGFAVLGIFMTAFFVSRAGLNVEVYDRGEAIGTVRTVSAKVTNNSFETMRGVTVQFGENGVVQELGDMSPFRGIMVSPHNDDNLEFDRVIATANGGEITQVKMRNMQQVSSH